MVGLRIGIDGYNLALPHGTGVATYGRVLARILAAAGHRIDGIFGLDPRAAGFAHDLTRDPPPRGSARDRIARAMLNLRALPPRLSAVARDVPGCMAVPDGRLPAFARIASSAGLFGIAHRHFNRYDRVLPLRMADPPAIMHWTYPLPIRLEGARNIYTLHDLVPLRMPEATRDNAVNYRRLVRRCVEAGDHIVTVSEASRDEIIELLDAAPDRVTNTYQAAPPPPPPTSASEAILRRLALPPGGYFLFFGTIEPKKNIARLVAAFEAATPSHPLLIVGAAGWGGEAAMAAARASARVILLDPLPADALAGLVRAARAVLFPSLWEGFGLPVLETMQAGTPVLTARIGALPEVAGQAALLVDPTDIAAIAAGIRALDEDASLRRRLAAAGPVQAESFSAARYLGRLETLYARVLAAGAPLA